MPQNAFKQSMQLNRRSFDLGMFDAAYHFLAGALSIASSEQSERGMIEVETTAIEQLAYIDAHHPEYHHSTESSANRNHINIFGNLARQASIKQLLLDLKGASHPRILQDQYGEFFGKLDN